MKLAEVLNECEVIYTDEDGEILNEAARRAFKRIGKEIKRRYRCTTGPKKGRVVANPIVCATRKDPRKVRHGRKVARTKKGVRLRKTKIMKRTAMSKLARRMNKRLSGTKRKVAKKSSTVKSSVRKASQMKKMPKSSSTVKPVKSK